jgi:hypothetical protein
LTKKSYGGRRLRTLLFFTCLALGGARGKAHGQQPPVVPPAQPGFMVRCNTTVVPYGQMALFALPGDTLSIDALGAADRQLALAGRGGSQQRTGRNAWRWIAPQGIGLYPLTIRDSLQADSIVINCLVMEPYARLQNGFIDKYRIGRYPISTDPSYQPPRGFIKVTEENQNTPVSPHFTLKDFLCKQSGGFPKYLALNERLVLKLEMVLEALKARGYTDARLKIMSGFRTPSYNKAIGNVAFSRHQWGDAADIFIDNDGDEMIDDLNGDGKHDVKDARIIHSVVSSLSVPQWCDPLDGGLGLYEKNPFRTAFVHVDTRGKCAQWQSVASATAGRE